LSVFLTFILVVLWADIQGEIMPVQKTPDDKTKVEFGCILCPQQILLGRRGDCNHHCVDEERRWLEGKKRKDLLGRRKEMTPAETIPPSP
jgi:hypothetical protein